MLVSGPRSMSDLAEGAVEVPLSAFGVPSVVCARYEQQHVTSLFGWQTECLLIGGGRVLRGERNLVYSAPTSGGKTLVAEVLMLYRLAALQKSHLGAPSPSGPRQRGLGTILFVVPFVALAEEKASYFQRMWRDMHIGVQAYHGDDEGRSGVQFVVVVLHLVSPSVFRSRADCGCRGGGVHHREGQYYPEPAAGRRRGARRGLNGSAVHDSGG